MPDTIPEKKQKIVHRVIEDEMKQSYLDYSMSVIVGRALPDVRDGLKPVHRRILFAMHEMGMFHNKPFKKSARIVGDCLGKFHPHGDMAVYDALVRMVQPFSLRYPLIKGQGNFGSVDGDSAAAMRYCITGDSLILTDKGIIPVSKISDEEESCIDINILSLNGKQNHASRFFDSGRHKLIEIETALGYRIRGSYNHPLLCWALKDNNPTIEWKLLENIHKNDIVLLNRGHSLFANCNLNLSKFKPKLNKRSKDIKLPHEMNKELAFLLGALVAEGSFHQNKIIFNNSDNGFYNTVKEIVYNQFKGVQLYERKIKGNCWEFELYHKAAVEFLKNIGLVNEKSDKKEIPFSVLQSPKGIIIEFLKGMFEGDGSVGYKIDKRHYGKSIELTYNSKSRILTKQLKTLLLNFGIVTTKPYKDKRNECYKLIISGYDSIKQFKEKIGFYSTRKNSILANVDHFNHNRMSKTDFIPFISKHLRGKYKNPFIAKNNFDRYNNLRKNYERLINLIDHKDKKIIDFLTRNKYLFDKVANIRKPEKEGKVYSIKVESNCHSFVANGFINHNTETKLSRLAEEMLQDIDKETVKFVPNFDGSLEEPVFLPAKLPNILINGSSGIAVGMATNIPPHNMTEVVDAITAMIDNAEITIPELMQIIKGPDFPTAGLIVGRKGIENAYLHGRGKVIVRAKTEAKDSTIIISEIPYMINKSQLLEEIADLVRDGKITGISDIRDESDREGMRVVIKLKKEANSEIVLNQLFNHTRMQTTFGIIMLALVDNAPRVLNLRQLLRHYIEHRRMMVRKRTEFDLKKAQHQAHILEGLIIALNNLDKTIMIIKKSKSVDTARQELIANFTLSSEQAQAILDMRLQRLTSLETEKTKKEHSDLLKLIEELKSILASEQKILGIIKDELRELKEKYGDKRRTQILGMEEEAFEMEELIAPEEMVITITHSGYIKRIPVKSYRQQKRGGKGVIATATKEEDFVEDLFIANTHDYILFFTSKGKIHWLKVYEIAEAARTAKGKSITNMLKLAADEKITAFIPVKEFSGSIVMATRKGTIKKTLLSLFSNPRKGGIAAIGLKDNDSLVDVILVKGGENILIATRKGMAVKFKESDVREMGRGAAGVRGIRLKKEDDYVVGMVIADDEKSLLTVTTKGYGKRTSIKDYRLISRGGSGVTNIKCTLKNGKVVAIKSVDEKDQLMLISKGGIAIRIPVKDISEIGRATQGVRVMKLEENDRLVAAAKIVQE